MPNKKELSPILEEEQNQDLRLFISS